MIQFLSRFKMLLIFLILEIVLFATNYRPGTFLVGWDNVYPELNFSANVTRSLFSIWQEYRGLGIIDGMAHGANMVHTAILYMLSFFLPQNILRYTVQLGLHLLGGIGAYFLILKLLRSVQKLQHHSPVITEIVALFGGLFYQYNLATVQMFYAPLELFSFHFAFLPVLLLLILEFLDHPTRKNLIIFSACSILSIPQAHVPSVFIVYILAVFAILGFYIFENKFTNYALKRILVILIIIFGLNAFWGLPYVYTTLNASKTIVNSKINRMATEDIVLNNKEFGDFKSVALFQGFSLNNVDFQPEGENDYMMLVWRNHVKNVFVLLISWSFFIICVVGIIAVIHSKEKKFYPFLFLFIVSFLFLGNDIPLISLVSQFIQEKIPLFYNVFRFTFTKFSLIYALTYSILLTFGLLSLLDVVKGYREYKTIILICIFITLLIYSLPSFQGQFFYDNLKAPIPQRYFDLIRFFRTQDISSRIMILPQPTFWGWTYYQWGVRGSGFLWYGIPQATMDGAFYPWSRENENYYWELSKALYSQDRVYFDKLLDKYQIDWIILDKSLQSPFSPKALFLDQMKSLLTKSQEIQQIYYFESIEVYKVNQPKTRKYISLIQNALHIEPKYNWSNTDTSFEDYSDYISANDSEINTNDQIYYPFRSLFSGRSYEENEFKIVDNENYIIFQNQIPKNLAGTKLVIQPIKQFETATIVNPDDLQPYSYMPQLYLDGELLNIRLLSEIEATNSANPRQEFLLPYIHEGKFEVRIPKIKGYYSYDSDITKDLNYISPTTCDQFNKGQFIQELNPYEKRDLLKLTSIGSSNCFNIQLDNLSHRLGYLASIESMHIEGKSILFSIINKNSQRSDLETYLPKFPKLSKSYYVLSPMEEFGLGYTLHFDNISIGRVKTVNDLGRITVNPIPYRFLTSLKIIKGIALPLQGDALQNIKVDHPNPSYYQVSLNSSTIGGVHSATPEVSLSSSNNVTLILSQSYDKGWKAYEVTNELFLDSWYMKLLIPFFHKEIPNHVLVNNWENGWILENPKSKIQNPKLKDGKNTTIVIVYLPQYLEYLGFVLLVGLIVLIYARPRLFSEV